MNEEGLLGSRRICCFLEGRREGRGERGSVTARGSWFSKSDSLIKNMSCVHCCRPLSFRSSSSHPFLFHFLFLFSFLSLIFFPLHFLSSFYFLLATSFPFFLLPFYFLFLVRSSLSSFPFWISSPLSSFSSSSFPSTSYSSCFSSSFHSNHFLSSCFPFTFSSFVFLPCSSFTFPPFLNLFHPFSLFHF